MAAPARNALRRRRSHPLIGALVAAALPLTSAAADFSGQAAVEGRLFPQDATQPRLYRGNLSAWIEPEIYHDFDDGRQRVVFTPFARIDQHDSRRTHFDIRELSWQYFGSSWELRAGIRKVYWGVAESNHLVDVINQTDFVEDLDGEQKLGQPMVNFALIRPWGTVDFFVLAGARERLFPGPRARPGVPFAFDQDLATFDAARGRGAVDFAVRWAHTLGPWDIGVSHFRGTTRDPSFRPQTNSRGQTVFAPHYDRINQTGLDLQLTQGGWLWKLETINRSGQGDRFLALVGGFEYTLSNLTSSGMDLGLLVEYNFDERDERALTILEDDIFLGARLAFNDVQSTTLLAGAAVDRESGAAFALVEASRRFGSRWTLDVELRSFVGVPREDLFLYGIRNDDYVEATWSFHW